jgi:multidrug efflux pump subunit AcrA (membrane-fusion protein)
MTTQRLEGERADRPGVQVNGWRPGARGARGRWLLRVAVLAVLAAAAVWAYTANTRRGGMEMRVTPTAGPPAFPVTTVTIEPGAVRGTVTYTGSVAALNEEDIYPRVTGRIVEMPAYPGDQVRAGQVVARLDDVELTSRVREAAAAAAAADAGRAQMEADLTAAGHGVAQMEKELAMVEAERGYAASVATRSERLLAVGAIARQEWENDQAMAVALDAKVQAAVAKLAQARAMETATQRKLQAGEAMAAQSQAVLRTATVVREYVTITAPGAGYVVKRLVAPGVLVQPGMAILKIAQVDRVRLQANVSERDLPRLRIGTPVLVTVPARGDVVRAQVTSVFPFVEPGARTAVVEALVDNPGRRLLPGQYARMEFVTGERPAALGVPRTALERVGGRAAVWVVREGRLERRTVETGLEGSDRVEVTAGLERGERVVVNRRDGLYPGAKVVEAAAMSAPPAAVGPPAGPAAKPREGSHGGH